ncbi:hypothetical protein C8R45DRAFT_637186 [Mycena sanguinolenta]|nr:hypothetical protein C8R45DRAFT_637186 [Mycena sanguinolenta]
MTSAVPDDNTKPEKGPVVISRTAEIGQASSDLWSLYLKEANERAMAKVDLWKGSLKAFLLFAGLFAAVVSPFVIDSQAKLQPTSPAAKVPISTLAINFLWFTSLTLTLISALAAVLAQTWIVKFSLVPTQGFNGAKERWIRDDQAEHWHLHAAITWITVLIQLSLFLFLAGFAVQAVADDKSLGWTILSFVGATLVLYIGITMLPWFYPTTPFGTPFSELSGRARNMFILEAPSVNAATKSKRDVRKFLQSLWENIGKTPDDDEARLGICWSILKNSSNNASINAAVLKLTRQKITRVQSRRLIELGLPDELSTRLTHLPPEKTATVVDRMRDYLHVIMWMVDECAQDVAQRFSHLVESEDALLLSLDTLPPTCRALAFAIRVNLLVGMCKVGRIHGTDWTAMIDGLDFTVALDVFRAAIRGLVTDIDSVSVKGQSSHHLRQDCARVLGAYIGSARFSNEELVKARISGDTLRMVRPQQESRGQIKKFLFQLEESWKRAMCTRTIQLMEDVRFDRHIIGCQALSSLIEQETFRDAVNDVFPDLGSTLKAVDWKNFRDALSRLSEILPQDSLGL